MSPAETLDEAADYIVEHGWTRGRFVDSSGGVCVLGALNAVVTGNTLIHLHSIVHRAVAKDVGNCLSAWNDLQTSAQPVIRQLRVTAQRLRDEA